MSKSNPTKVAIISSILDYLVEFQDGEVCKPRLTVAMDESSHKVIESMTTPSSQLEPTVEIIKKVCDEQGQPERILIIGDTSPEQRAEIEKELIGISLDYQAKSQAQHSN